MKSNGMVGFSDADSATLAEIVADLEKSTAAIAAAQAAHTRALARAGELAEKQAAGSPARVREHDMALRAIAAEIAVAVRTTDRTVQRQIGSARELVESYPATLQAWEAGRITRGHVYVVTETGAHLPPDAREQFDRTAADRCLSDTPGRVRSELEILAQRLHPRTLTERHRDARADRAVTIRPLGDGMSMLTLTHDSLLIDAIHDRITQQALTIKDARRQAAAERSSDDPEIAARAARIGSDTRGIDQVRADLLADMLLTSAPDADPTRSDDGPGTLGAIRAKVQVVVPALTLLGDDGPADLVGHSPIDADTARRLAGTGRSDWDRILTHPVTGVVLHVDRYRPSEDMRRWLRARDQHCRFPGCRIPAVRCEIDHQIDWALGGKTEIGNNGHFCQRHHTMKQFTAWRVRQLDGGVFEWTSPLGRTYTENPPGLGVHFTAASDAAPSGAHATTVATATASATDSTTAPAAAFATAAADEPAPF